MPVRWVWELGAESPQAGRPPLRRPPVVPGLEVRVIPAQGLSVIAGVMAQTLRGLATRDQIAEFLRRARGPVGDTPRGLPSGAASGPEGGAGDVEPLLLPFVAYLGGRPVATALLVLRGRSAQLFGGIHVVADQRRKGIGQAVLGATLRYAGTSGASRVWVARDVGDPPTAEDAAATSLYDRAGGIRRRPLVEVVYTPQCPWSPHFVAEFEREVAGLDVEFKSYDLWHEPGRSWELVRAAGVTGNVFFQAFVDGEPAGGAPPVPGALRQMAGLASGVGATLGRNGLPRQEGATSGGWAGGGGAATAATSAEPWPDAETPPYPRAMPRVAEFAQALEGLSLEPLLSPGSEALMDMCLAHHPSGYAPAPLAAVAGSSLKRRWLESLKLPGGFFGVAARRGDHYAGIMEVYPRAIAAKAGYATGTWGDGSKVMTITCIEIARGEKRQPVMEYLLEGLVAELGRRLAGEPYRDVEALGNYGDLAGFNPYWLFDKYGFERREDRVPGISAVLSRSFGA